MHTGCFMCHNYTTCKTPNECPSVARCLCLVDHSNYNPKNINVRQSCLEEYEKSDCISGCRTVSWTSCFQSNPFPKEYRLYSVSENNGNKQQQEKGNHEHNKKSNKFQVRRLGLYFLTTLQLPNPAMAVNLVFHSETAAATNAGVMLELSQFRFLCFS